MVCLKKATSCERYSWEGTSDNGEISAHPVADPETRETSIVRYMTPSKVRRSDVQRHLREEIENSPFLQAQSIVHRLLLGPVSVAGAIGDCGDVERNVGTTHPVW